MKKSLWFAGAAVLLSAGVANAVGRSAQPRGAGQPRPVNVAMQGNNDDPSQWPDWKIHSNWCANVDNGSSHRVYLSNCSNGQHDQYDSVLACQRDAGLNNGDGGRAVRAIEAAGRPAVNAFMADKHPTECDKQ